MSVLWILYSSYAPSGARVPQIFAIVALCNPHRFLLFTAEHYYRNIGIGPAGYGTVSFDNSGYHSHWAVAVEGNGWANYGYVK